MSHLAIERLAELASGEPQTPERDHLAECAMCSSELSAYRRVVALAADERRRIAPPLTSWGALRGELLNAGVIVTPVAGDPPAPVLRVLAVARRVAAALLLVAGGTVFGRLTVGVPVREALALNDMRFSGLRDASGGGPPATMNGQEFASTAAALAALRKAQQDYEHAAQYLAVSDTTSSEASSELYRARLAALDRMAETSLRELQRRPQDPIMNQLYLTTLGVRNQTLTKLGTALPVGTRLTRF